jgi:hypothetical protein
MALMMTYSGLILFTGLMIFAANVWITNEDDDDESGNDDQATSQTRL